LGAPRLLGRASGRGGHTQPPSTSAGVHHALPHTHFKLVRHAHFKLVRHALPHTHSKCYHSSTFFDGTCAGSWGGGGGGGFQKESKRRGEDGPADGGAGGGAKYTHTKESQCTSDKAKEAATSHD